jgi:hypothetical protein
MTMPMISDSLAALLKRQEAERQARALPRPRNYQRPAFGTDAYRDHYRTGWISFDEYQADELNHVARVKRARSSLGTFASPPNRWRNAEPKQNRQYANPMSTEAMHDSRLTMGARALLVELRARCGKGIYTEATKYGLALALNRSTRTIQRYLKDLIQFGYIVTQTRADAATRLYTGLRIKLTEKVTPFFAKAGELAGWMAEKGLSFLESGNSLEFPEETKTSSKNHPINLFSFLERPHGRRGSESAFGR